MKRKKRSWDKFTTKKIDKHAGANGCMCMG